MAVIALENREEKPALVQRVAVIGAGVSGVSSARYLKASGLDVVVFERSKQAGGNWLYDERQPLEPTYPSVKASTADFVIEKESKNGVANGETNGVRKLSPEEEELAFAPPGPAYSGLTNNVPTTLQNLKGFPWPEGTPDFVNVRDKQRYIQGYSKNFNIEPLIRYNTRVERLQKIDRKWQVTFATLVKGEAGGIEKVRGKEEFDYVVVASGHYHSPRVPDIPGLKEWKSAWPERVQHSKRYRVPNEFKDQTVLLIGAGVSSTDIAREITPFAKKIYQSSRGGQFDLPLGFLPEGTDRVADVASFEVPPPSNNGLGAVTLTDGTVLHVDRVVICTGYLMTVPFLPELVNDSIPVEAADEKVIVTDGTQYHNLHKDIFYIPDPTLAFVGVPAYSATFTFFEFQAIAVDAVFSRRAKLPPTSQLRAEYQAKVEKKGFGRAFHSVRDEEVEYVKELVDWINSTAEAAGAKKVESHSEQWIEERKLLVAKYLGRMKVVV